MGTLLARKAIEETARRHGISPEEVYMEIRAAIDAAILSQASASKGFWSAIPYQQASLTPEELITYISDLIA